LNRKHGMRKTYLLAVAKLDIPLDNATVIHHCGGFAPLPRRCTVTALSLPRSITPYDRALVTRHHLPSDLTVDGRPVSRTAVPPLFYRSTAARPEKTGISLRHRAPNHAAKSILPRGERVSPVRLPS